MFKYSLMSIIILFLIFIGILDILDKYPYEVSGGQKQIVAVARVLITNDSYITYSL
jgi:ABC-type polar amino acid transport system ATPase subunit